MSFSPVIQTFILIGLMVIIAGLLAWLVILQTRFSRLHRQYRRLMTGVDSANLETVLNDHLDQVRDHVQTVQELKTQTRQIERTLKHSMQWMGLIRFNPFRDTGGNQSFAWAIVDGYGNGIVLSSLHSREGTRFYAKPLDKWESPHSLTDEEKQAIARAYQQQG
ncbi:MAG: DUF4446 family protein [Anaerolineae bacterium]|nr:DUF4446 family protein [Anaerolineae bacterium]